MLKLKPTKIFIATIFSFALLFPIAIQTIHTFEGHAHQVCNDYTTHLHKKQLDCSICDFHFSIFDYKPQQIADLFAPVENFKLEIEYRKSYVFSDTPHFFLRGPPLFS